MFYFRILLFAVTVKLTVVSGIEELGCDFVNNRYQIRNGPVQDPIYGSVPIGIKFTSKAQLDTFLNEMTTLSEQLVSTYPFNTVDDFLFFYKNYEIFKDIRRLEDFFKTYRPHYFILRGFLGSAIDLLVTTSRKNSISSPHMKSSVFLAAAQYDIPMTEEELQKLDTKYLNSTMGQRINHVYAVVKFYLNSVMGYFLFDPTFSLVKPIIVLDKGNKLPGDTLVRNKDEKNNIVYEILKSNPSFIVGRHEGTNKLQFLIYVGQSYCSVLDVTEKLELLRYDRYFIKRDKSGWGTAGIYFNALPDSYCRERKIVDRNTFTVFEVTNSSNFDVTVKKLKFSDFAGAYKMYSSLTTSEFSFFRKVANQLGTTAHDLGVQMNDIASLMNDETFLVKLHKILQYVYTKSNDQAANHVIEDITSWKVNSDPNQ